MNHKNLRKWVFAIVINAWLWYAGFYLVCRVLDIVVPR